MPRQKTQEIKSYTDEELQEMVNAAAEGHYYLVAPSLTKHAKIIGGPVHWSKGEDYVYSPSFRVCGPSADVEAVLELMNVKPEERGVISSAQEDAYKQESAEYLAHRKTISGISDDLYATIITGASSLKKAKPASKAEKSSPEASIKATLKHHPAVGRVYNVSSLLKEKPSVSEIAAVSSTATSSRVGVPGIYIVSDNRDAYVRALEIMEMAEDKKTAAIAAWDHNKALLPEKKTKSVKAPANATASKAKAPAAKKQQAKPAVAKKVAAK